MISRKHIGMAVFVLASIVATSVWARSSIYDRLGESGQPSKCHQALGDLDDTTRQSSPSEEVMSSAYRNARSTCKCTDDDLIGEFWWLAQARHQIVEEHKNLTVYRNLEFSAVQDVYFRIRNMALRTCVDVSGKQE